MKRILVLFAFLILGEQIYPQVWKPVGAGLNGEVYALLHDSVNDILYAGGDFTFSGSLAVNHIAKWDGSSWSQLGSGMNGSVYTLASYSGSLYAGGWFTEAGGSSAVRIAKWDGSSWTAMGQGANTLVSSMCVYQSRLIVAGSFTMMDNNSALRMIAMWDGNNWSPIIGSPDDAIAKVYTNSTDGFLYVGGFFQYVGNLYSPYLAVWDGNSWSSCSGEISGGNYTGVYAINSSGTNLCVGGDFTDIDNTSYSFFAQRKQGNWISEEDAIDSAVCAIAYYKSEIYVGGIFQNAGVNNVSFIARLTETSSSIEPLDPKKETETEIEGVKISYTGNGIILESSEIGIVRIYDAIGREVKNFHKNDRLLTVNRDDLGSGIFIYKLPGAVGKFVIY